MYLLFISIFSYGIKADATLEMEQRDFIRAGLEYVCLIQEVQERKKFEFVETVSLIVAALGIYPTHLFSYMYNTFDSMQNASIHTHHPHGTLPN